MKIKKIKEGSVPVQKARPPVELWVRQVWVKVFGKFENSHSRKGKTVVTDDRATLGQALAC